MLCLLYYYSPPPSYCYIFWKGFVCGGGVEDFNSRLLAWPGSGTPRDCAFNAPDHHLREWRQVGPHPTQLSCVLLFYYYYFFFLLGTECCYDQCVREYVVVYMAGGQSNFFFFKEREKEEKKKSRTRSGSPSLSVTVRRIRQHGLVCLFHILFFFFLSLLSLSFLGREPKKLK